MILIIGGAYQGKLDYAESAFLLSPEEIFTCTGTEIDFSKRCINALEEFCYACVQKGIDPVAFFREHEDAWQDSILICNDLSSGVVPVDPVERRWRHSTGQLCQYLAGQARQVSRIFCGLEQRLK